MLLAGVALIAAEPISTDWLLAHGPYGFDVTPDGTVWINTDRVGQIEDYAIRAEDLQSALAQGGKQVEPRFWVRGYHKRNPKVVYRESKALFRVNCRFQTIATDYWITYDENGSTLATSSLGKAATPIVPGSIGETWARMMCAAK